LGDPEDEGMSAGQVLGPRWSAQRQMPTVVVSAGPNYKLSAAQRKPTPLLPA
jgi:hypothetical protein